MTCKKNMIIKKIGILIIILSLPMPGCRQSSREPAPQQQSQQAGQQSDKVPKQLTGIEDSIERIIKSLDGPAVGVKEEKKEEKEGAQQDKAGQETKKEGEGEGDQEKKGGEGEEGGQQKKGAQQDQAAQKPKQRNPWEEITPVMNSLHYQWNSFMPSAVKMGANRTLVDNFSNALNNLTNTVIAKNKTNTLVAASRLYSYIPDFYSLYRTKTSPEIKRIRHYTRNAMLSAMNANWTQADQDINSLKSSWSLYKNTLSRDQQDSSNKLDFSIYELEKVIKDRSQPLTDIKGRVAMANVETLEKSAEKQAGQADKEGGKQEGEGQSGGDQSGGGQGEAGS